MRKVKDAHEEQVRRLTRGKGGVTSTKRTKRLSWREKNFPVKQFRRYRRAKGIQAIIELQKQAGIDEPFERAAKNWDNFSVYDKVSTTMSHKLLFTRDPIVPKPPKPITANIWWKDIKPDYKVKLRGLIYVVTMPNSGQDARQVI